MADNARVRSIVVLVATLALSTPANETLERLRTMVEAEELAAAAQLAGAVAAASLQPSDQREFHKLHHEILQRSGRYVDAPNTVNRRRSLPASSALSSSRPRSASVPRSALWELAMPRRAAI